MPIKLSKVTKSSKNFFSSARHPEMALAAFNFGPGYGPSPKPVPHNILKNSDNYVIPMGKCMVHHEPGPIDKVRPDLKHENPDDLL